MEEPRPKTDDSHLSKGSIKVTSLVAKTELDYSDLDNSTKESILTELLVKSAVTHAIKKQKVMSRPPHSVYAFITYIIVSRIVFSVCPVTPFMKNL